VEEQSHPCRCPAGRIRSRPTILGVCPPNVPLTRAGDGREVGLWGARANWRSSTRSWPRRRPAMAKSWAL
jgi:hypothetical protein